jgi:carboxymethylenebutenolidase
VRAVSTGSPHLPRTEADVVAPDGATLRTQLVLPEGSPPDGGWPGVIVLHEAYGLHPYITAVGERFAARGWAAALPDVLSAGTSTACLVRAMREIQAGKPAATTARLEAVRAWFAARPEVAGDKVAVIGFCMGGGLALLLGSASDGIGAVSANYGLVPRTETLRGCAPVIAAYGTKDRAIGPQGKVLEKRLTEAGVEHDVRCYDTGHSFLTPGTSPKLTHRLMGTFIHPVLHGGYDADLAEKEWPRIYAWFEDHLSRPLKD